MATKNHFSNYENLFSAYRESVSSTNSIRKENIQTQLNESKVYFESLKPEKKEIEDQIVTICESFDIEKTFFVMNIQNEKLRNFLRDLRTDFIEAYNNKDYSKVDELIKRREGNLKTNRAKIDHPEKYDVSKLLEYPKFDFRFGIVQRHIKDIQEGENA